MDRRERLHSWLAIALLIAVPMAVCFPIAGHPPVYDDHLLLGGNADILEGRTPLGGAFGRPYWGSSPEAALNEIYRPLAIASLGADARLAGSGPAGMHVTALLLHAANVLLVYMMVTLLFGRRAMAFLTALLFSVHPIVLEVVAPLSGRSDLLAAFFLLSASCLVLIFARGDGWKAHAALCGVILACAAGVLSKEHVAVAPLVLGALLLALDPAPRRSRIAMAMGGAAAGVLAAVALRGQVLGYLWRTGAPLDPQTAYLAWVGNPLLEAGIVPRLLTAAKIAGKAVGLLFFPAGQSADYCYDQIAVEQGPGGPAAWLGVGLIVACGAALLKWRRRRPVLWIAIAWAGLTFLLTSNAVIPIGAIFAERFLYLPAAGASLAVAALLWSAASGGAGTRRRRFAAGAGLLLAGVWIGLFLDRRSDWSSDLSLFSATAEASPRCARGHSNHGLALQRDGRLDEATAAYERALAIAPGLTGTGIALTGALLELNRSEEAVDAARRAARSAGDDPGARRVLADLLVAAGLSAIDAGDDRRFLATTEAAAAIDPSHATAHFNLALHAYRARDPERARRHTRDAQAAGYVLPKGFLEAVGLKEEGPPIAGR